MLHVSKHDTDTTTDNDTHATRHTDTQHTKQHAETPENEIGKGGEELLDGNQKLHASSGVCKPRVLLAASVEINLSRRATGINAGTSAGKRRERQPAEDSAEQLRRAI
jgi:hypothetical protein